ncbi:putative fructose-2,6-bisphosphatase TIGAR A [Menidia menidia]|uniref:fructose-2,6-bisphosphate 2-phosphatase n=1 Tax=Menidia menidia TaxID=238744 RepID=A0A8S4BJM5_9TELE|nr:unnamed protein product [Menidia menidia]
MRLPSVLTGDAMRTLTFALTLVRHGETPFNKQGLLQGQTIDAPLSETGLQQAEAAGRYLRDVRFSNVFVSDMLRARQTAEMIMKHNSSCSNLQMVCDPLLKEKSFGTAEGLRVQDYKEMAKAAGEAFPDFTPPGGETPEQVKQRVRGFLDKTLQHIGSEHWQARGQDATSQAAPPAASPVEGRAEDGAGGLPVHALVVSHGAYMRVALRLFVEELGCRPPPGCDPEHLFSLSPNTGLCRFLLSIKQEGSAFILSGICCVFVHRRDHLEQ